MLQITPARCADLSDSFTNALSSVLIIIFFLELSRFCSAGAAQAAAHTHTLMLGEPDQTIAAVGSNQFSDFNIIKPDVLWQLASSL